ncbi:MAG: nitrilase-related carbon-nitrogen hydrolase, partial [Myxococcota bacterium]|nr:nitrilase-related carbon-nitrogen hydrolase [Myxococcota bacterium]
EGDKPDILLFHEFPLTGYVYGDRDNKLRFALEIPGPESDSFALLAKECDTYVVFGAYAKDPAWPKHILSLTTIIDRKGEITKKVWKARNIKRFYSTFEITTTTVEGVQDRFREQYGIADAFPVIQTEFGNIAVSTVQLDPLVFNAYAMQGAEIILRTATLFFQNDVTYTAMVNNVYSAMANIPYDSPYGGGSLIVSPDGEILSQHPERLEEGIVSATIPIAQFRKNRRLPQYSVDLTRAIFQQYREEIPPNHLDIPEAKLPRDGKEMKALLDERSRWLSPTESPSTE